MITKRERIPLDLGLLDVDMKAVAGTQYLSGVLDVRQHFNHLAIITIAETGTPTAGAAKVILQVLSKDQSTVLYEIDLITAIDTQINLAKNILTFGAGLTAKLVNQASAAGTIGADIEIFKLAEYFKIGLEVVTQNDGTTSTASLRLLSGS
jgi:hypothetical protein